jgi:hypothetical protein
MSNPDMASTHDDDIARMMNDDIEEPMEKAQDEPEEEEIKVSGARQHTIDMMLC